MTLNEYLKQFNNICWYPSACTDSLAMVCLSKESLADYGISREEAPDCFVFTDYIPFTEHEKSERFLLDPFNFEEGSILDSRDSGLVAKIFNVKELSKLKLPFNQKMVHFGSDRYYGKVFVADILIRHPSIGETITKLIYVIAENTAFALDFLIKKNIKVKYVVHSNYGHGFGGGISNGTFICNILKELGTKYFASDITEHYDDDIADIYLTKTQKSTFPVLKIIDNFYHKFKWEGYDHTLFYEAIGYKEIDSDKFHGKRFFVYSPTLEQI